MRPLKPAADTFVIGDGATMSGLAEPAPASHRGTHRWELLRALGAVR